MEDLKAIIAKNITELRKKNNMTQIELAEKINYSDKAVSKWERGESVPDISVLKQIADMFSVTVDYLINEEHIKEEEETRHYTGRRLRNRMLITAISITLVWFVAIFIYSNVDLVVSGKPHWLTFLYAVPASMIVWLVFNTIWFNRRRNFLIISLLMWSALACFYISMQVFGFDLWLFFLLGIPGQIIIILWSGLRSKKRKKNS